MNMLFPVTANEKDIVFTPEWKLEAYSIPPREFKKKFTQIEKRLVKAWEAL
jgi:hypothetical protein